MGRTPVVAGTRVPAQTPFGRLEADDLDFQGPSDTFASKAASVLWLAVAAVRGAARAARGAYRVPGPLSQRFRYSS